MILHIYQDYINQHEIIVFLRIQQNEEHKKPWTGWTHEENSKTTKEFPNKVVSDHMEVPKSFNKRCTKYYCQLEKRCLCICISHSQKQII